MEETATPLQEEYNILLESFKRSRADYLNLEKRVSDERALIIKYANENLIIKLLPIVDALEEAVKKEKVDGVKLILKDFIQLLSDLGVSEIKATGETFDPSFHEAVDVTSGEENKVMQVVRKGYTLNGKVLRPARVLVGKLIV
ncbi:nucleotide exchange factor GrpE [candidate division WWE3 bacterium CG08_land_8_20_14_0_20_41_15]|uniref:Protein GrpE n=1 Tax=candidate division WWE3 bacterium CG08_land_8_20_14_0_20_41_15 TaxID=1975086 RepID=A0A2H0X9A7_UNCKA|nr:MAG: nucleotide exchange factor GrpE [candidate division WWE3 bacterium CG08_land_8_20_14_0_20_41_15]